MNVNHAFGGIILGVNALVTGGCCFDVMATVKTEVLLGRGGTVECPQNSPVGARRIAQHSTRKCRPRNHYKFSCSKRL